MKRVAIIGGGVSGLCAAHELLENGFAVDIYERNNLPGGKARSFDVPSKEHMPAKGLKNLPAEHGFRFFPGFYRHLDETMDKVRYATNTSVRDALVHIDQMNYARFGKDIVPMPAVTPSSVGDMLKMLKKWVSDNDIDMPVRDLLKYWLKLAKFFGSCDERVQEAYEEVPWWEFLGADSSSLQYRRFFASSSRILVAADPLKASTKTNGMITEQFIFDLNEKKADRVLPGPTNQTWLFPWLEQLHQHPNLQFFFNAEVTDIVVASDGRSVEGIVIQHRGKKDEEKFSRLTGANRETGPELTLEDLPSGPVSADYFICATPVEVAANYVGKPGAWTRLGEVAPSLQTLDELSSHTQWMNGVLFYLKGDVSDLHSDTISGHSVYIDTPFALTSLFQEQHWDSVDFPMPEYGNGALTGICSVCVSNWNDTQNNSQQLPNGGKGRLYNKSAAETLYNNGDFEEGKVKLKNELWTDLKDSLTVNGRPILNDNNLLHWHIDPAIHVHKNELVNTEPLLVNRVKGWRLRPETDTELSNLFMAGDYVRTNTDLATMEAACESGVRASNAIIGRHWSRGMKLRKIHALKRLPAFAPLRFLDKLRYRAGH